MKFIVILFISIIYSISIGSSDYSYSRYRVITTGYCPCSICCGKFADGITATGTNAYNPGIAIDPNIFDLGSHFDVPGYNRRKNGSWIKADDTGSKIKGYHIDLRFKTHKEAMHYGKKIIYVRVWNF